jgi:hypothetical protein
MWRDLGAAGFVSGHAYGKALRTVKTCVGSEWCRFGTQDSTGLGIQLEKMTWGSWTPHKFKMGVSGCPRNCAEATIKDLGVVCVDSGYEIHVGGNGGVKVRVTDFLCKVTTESEVLEMAGAFMQLYREEARYLERTAPWIERVGLSHVQQAIVEDPPSSAPGCTGASSSPSVPRRWIPGRSGRRDARRTSSSRSGQCRCRQANRGGIGMNWVDLCELEAIPRLGARVVQGVRGDIAVFRTANDGVFALDDRCPHKGGRLSQGIVHGGTRDLPTAQLGDRPGLGGGNRGGYRLYPCPSRPDRKWPGLAGSRRARPGMRHRHGGGPGGFH